MSSTSDKQAPNPKRSTFLTGQQVIERTRDALEGAIETLERVEAGSEDERSRLLRERLVSLERDLVEALERYQDAAPEAVRDEQTQYTVEIPDELLHDRKPPEDVEDAMSWSLALLGSLHDRFAELAESASAEVARESHDKLAELVTVHRKRIAGLEQDRQDL